MGEKLMRWIKWAFSEALARTASMTLIKVIGGAAGGLPLSLVSTLIIGTVQTSAAGGVMRLTRAQLFPSRRLVTGSVLFGVGAFVNSVIPFLAYGYGANIAVYTFLTLLAIAPGALIDRVCFGERTSFRQTCGIGLAVFAGWLVLNRPSLAELLSLPVWAWLALLNALGLAINQGISRWVKDVNIWTKNFWGGSTTSLLSLACLAFGTLAQEALHSPALPTVLGWSALIALVVIGIWSFNVIAYRDGAAIPVKHVVVNGTFLSLVVLVGFLVFGESVTLTQFGGMLVYLSAFAVINNEVWGYLTQGRKALT